MRAFAYAVTVCLCQLFVGLIILFLLLFAACCFAQPIPRAATFRWDAPTNMADIISYELQWGEQDKQQVPVFQREYEVWDFPFSFRQEVSVRSVSSMTNSEPTTIIIYNVLATLEESRNGTDWTSLATHNWIGERDGRAVMLRVKLSTE